MRFFPEQRTISPQTLWRTGADTWPRRTEAGVTVDYESAFTDDGFWAAVTLLAGDIAGLPWKALQMSGGVSKPLTRQPEWLDRPDPLDLAITDVAHKTQLALSILCDGNGFTLCEPDVYDPVSLMVLNPLRVKVTKPGRERLFEIRDDNGRKVGDTLTQANVIQTTYMLRPGQLRGMSPIDMQAGSLGISLAARKWLEVFFGKGGQVAGFVSLPVDAKSEAVEEVTGRIEKKYSGWRRAGVLGVLSGGAQFVKTGLTPKDIDQSALWRRQLEAAARIFGIPPFMIGSQEPAGVAYASSVERAQHYIDHCLMRYTRPIEKAYSRLVPGDGRLLSPGSNTEIRFNFDALLRGDTLSRFQAHAIALDKQFRTIEEVRELENLPPERNGTLLEIAPKATPPAAEPPPKRVEAITEVYRTEPTVNVSAPVEVNTPPVNITATAPAIVAVDSVHISENAAREIREEVTGQVGSLAVDVAQAGETISSEVRWQGSRIDELHERMEGLEAQQKADMARLLAPPPTARRNVKYDNKNRIVEVTEQRGAQTIVRKVSRDSTGKIISVIESAA